VCLLVIATDDGVARWAAKPIELGGGNQFVPLVLGPSGVPEVTDPALASADPELAVLSALAHGRGVDIRRAVRIALVAEAASSSLDENRRRLYSDLIWTSLSEGARKELQMFDPAKYKYEYQSEPARRWFSHGREEGRTEGRTEGEAAGRAALVCRLLTVRFGPLSAESEARVRSASIAELDAIGERLLTAPSLEEALGHH
jgi:hypothetical protein